MEKNGLFRELTMSKDYTKEDNSEKKTEIVFKS